MTATPDDPQDGLKKFGSITIDCFRKPDQPETLGFSFDVSDDITVEEAILAANQMMDDVIKSSAQVEIAALEGLTEEQRALAAGTVLNIIHVNHVSFVQYLFGALETIPAQVAQLIAAADEQLDIPSDGFIPAEPDAKGEVDDGNLA